MHSEATVEQITDSEANRPEPKARGGFRISKNPGSVYYPTALLRTAAASEALTVPSPLLSTQKESFEGYGAKQTKLINSAVLENKGYYVILTISKDADQIYEAFQKSI